jgi:hypothetical protein
VLRPGRYSIAVESPGFKKFVRTGVTLEIQAELRVDVALEIGGAAEQITVSADAVLLQLRAAR